VSELGRTDIKEKVSHIAMTHYLRFWEEGETNPLGHAMG
jgi:hypothetical protein